jgi:hypothetical protein
VGTDDAVVRFGLTYDDAVRGFDSIRIVDDVLKNSAAASIAQIGSYQ